MHQFIPSPTQIGAKHFSSDTDFSIIYDFSLSVPLMSDYSVDPNCYIACIYDSSWYVGLVEKVNNEKKDATVRFMHPSGPFPSFFWPEHDVCDVPFTQILCQVDITSVTGHTYCLSR